MYDEGLVSDGFMIENLRSHTNVVFQPPLAHPGFRGINPYALGFAMFSDIRRMCENPTEEDRQWFPDLAGSDWRQSLDHAMRNFRDESFVGQYLSPRLIRELRLFSILDDAGKPQMEVAAIHDDNGYRQVRQALSHQYDLSFHEPNIQVWSVDIRGDRSLTLRHTQHNNRPLNDEVREVLKHVGRLWGFMVRLESVDAHGKTSKQWDVAPMPRKNILA